MTRGMNKHEAIEALAWSVGLLAIVIGTVLSWS
jgi:hypothetical protein